MMTIQSLLASRTSTENRRIALALGALLPPIEAQLQRKNLQGIAPRLRKFFPPRYKDPSSLPDSDALLTALANLIRHLESERFEVVQRLEQASSAMADTPDSVGRRQAFRAWTQDVGGRLFKWRLSEWRKSANAQRFLDLESLKARYQRERLRADLWMELCLKLMGCVIEQALNALDPKQQELTGRRWLQTQGMEAFLAGQCLSRRSASRVLCFHHLQRLVETLPMQERSERLGVQTLRALFRCLEPREDRSVQLAAAGLLAVVARAEVLKILADRLLAPALESSTHEDDFAVRRGIIRLIAQHFQDDEGLKLLSEVAERGDESEAVRMSLVEALAAFPGEIAGELLRAHEAPGRLGDSSPRVRATVALTWSQWLVAGNPQQRTAQTALLRLIVQDSSDLVRRTALEEALSVLTEHPDAHLAFAVSLRTTLQQRLQDGSLSPPERSRCATALEHIFLVVSPEHRARVQKIQAHVQRLALGQSCVLSAKECGDEETLGRILAHLSRQDFGLYAQKTWRGFRITRGEHFVRRLWRILHEIRHRAPNKRQGMIHTRGRTFAGELRAHPGLLAEITATTVPGERLLSEQEGSWGRYLPLVDDLLCTPLLRRRSIRLFSAEGMTELMPPRSLVMRLYARAEISRHYEALSTLRRLALTSQEPEEQRLYVQKLCGDYGFSIQFVPHLPGLLAGQTDAENASIPSGGSLKRVFAAAAALTPPDPTGVLETWRVIWQDLLVRLSGSVAHLALMVLSLLLFVVARGAVKMRAIRKARKQIPLVVGGWGTRGKSGTERLKAAMFQGMGYEVLVKTTGCEAMVIHALPDNPATELFLYRPYDKATIWEQVDCLRLAAQLDVQVFLYECMALQPRYVNVIQNDWSQDDFSTLTNAYPDHEDIQGPSGVDVAWCISEFIREGGTVFTTEEQMLPVLKEAARRKSASLTHVSLRSSDLISEDFLRRFPYQEHPRNIALVVQLGVALGFEPDRILMEMADRVVPDIGVLKAYPWSACWGRKMQFVSGNSANERTGFMSNWQRMQFDAHDPVQNPQHWIMTVVNNRADRVSRSQVFADILVRDISAHKHVLIGTNISGLMQYIHESLEKFSGELTFLQAEDTGSMSEDTKSRRRQKFERFVHHMKCCGLDAKALISELCSWMPQPEGVTTGQNTPAAALLVDGDFFQRVQEWLLQPHYEALTGENSPSEGDSGGGSQGARRSSGAKSGLLFELERLKGPQVLGQVVAYLQKTGVEQHLPTPVLPIQLSRDETLQSWAEFFVRALARTRRLCYARDMLERGLAGMATLDEVNGAVRKVYCELFVDTLHPLDNAALSGDQIIKACASFAPPGTQVHVMGTQNIKGTGLDFVYRWASVGGVERILRGLRDPRRSKVVQALNMLREHPDYGIVDACMALETLETLKHGAQGTLGLSVQDELQATELHLKAVIQRRAALLEGQPGKAPGRLGLRVGLRSLEQVLEPLESVRRRDRARVISEALVEGLLSHERAAQELRKLNKEQKGGWLGSSLQ